MASSTKIAVHSLPDLKNTTDDALPNYLSSLRFKQSHYYTDVRLALGYTAAIIGGITFYLDWTLGFEKTKLWTAWAVVIYCVLNAAFSYWIFWVEKGVIYDGHWNGRQLTISTRSKKFTPIYYLNARFNTAAPSADKPSWREVEITAPFTRWFTADGYFVAKPFQQWLASEISLVGEADPANVVEEIGRGSGSKDGLRDVRPKSVEEVITGARNESSGGAKARRKR